MFKEIELSGSAQERGFEHGKTLRTSIEHVLNYYLSIFGLREQQVFLQAKHFRQVIRNFSPSIADEVEHIAEGASVDPLFIYALNARSEILNNSVLGPSVSECTALFCQRSGLLMQNWDWSEALEPLVVLMRMNLENGHKICQLTEPGIVGKIGLNNAGIGVCLNILKTAQVLKGVPVHILLRRALESQSFVASRQVLQRNSEGKASHLLLAAAGGACHSVEFCGPRACELSPHNDLLIHTNHYLDETAAGLDAFPSTHERFARAGSLCEQSRGNDGLSVEAAQALLLDRTEGELSINRAYSPSLTPGFGRVGTVFSIIMDLRQGVFWVRPGSSEVFTQLAV